MGLDDWVKKIIQGGSHQVQPDRVVSPNVFPVRDYSQPVQDLREAICPNCRKALVKIPAAKTKCPHCAKFIYSRFDPRVNGKSLIAEDDLDALEDAVAMTNGTYEERLRLKSFRAEVTENLRAKFGFEPSAADVNWGVIQRRIAHALASKDSHLLNMATNDAINQLLGESKTNLALNFIFDYLVLNHYPEIGGFQRMPGQNRTLLAPEWLSEVLRLSQSGELTNADIRDGLEKAIARIGPLSKIASLGEKISAKQIYEDLTADLRDFADGSEA